MLGSFAFALLAVQDTPDGWVPLTEVPLTEFADYNLQPGFQVESRDGVAFHFGLDRHAQSWRGVLRRYDDQAQLLWQAQTWQANDPYDRAQLHRGVGIWPTADRVVVAEHRADNSSDDFLSPLFPVDGVATLTARSIGSGQTVWQLERVGYAPSGEVVALPQGSDLVWASLVEPPQGSNSLQVERLGAASGASAWSVSLAVPGESFARISRSTDGTRLLLGTNAATGHCLRWIDAANGQVLWTQTGLAGELRDAWAGSGTDALRTAIDGMPGWTVERRSAATGALFGATPAQVSAGLTNLEIKVDPAGAHLAVLAESRTLQGSQADLQTQVFGLNLTDDALPWSQSESMETPSTSLLRASSDLVRGQTGEWLWATNLFAVGGAPRCYRIEQITGQVAGSSDLAVAGTELTGLDLADIDGLGLARLGTLGSLAPATWANLDASTASTTFTSNLPLAGIAEERTVAVLGHPDGVHAALLRTLPANPRKREVLYVNTHTDAVVWLQALASICEGWQLTNPWFSPFDELAFTPDGQDLVVVHWDDEFSPTTCASFVESFSVSSGALNWSATGFTNTKQAVDASLRSLAGQNALHVDDGQVVIYFYSPENNSFDLQFLDRTNGSILGIHSLGLDLSQPQIAPFFAVQGGFAYAAAFNFDFGTFTPLVSLRKVDLASRTTVAELPLPSAPSMILASPEGVLVALDPGTEPNQDALLFDLDLLSSTAVVTDQRIHSAAALGSQDGFAIYGDPLARQVADALELAEDAGQTDWTANNGLLAGGTATLNSGDAIFEWRSTAGVVSASVRDTHSGQELWVSNDLFGPDQFIENLAIAPHAGGPLLLAATGFANQTSAPKDSTLRSTLHSFALPELLIQPAALSVSSGGSAQLQLRGAEQDPSVDAYLVLGGLLEAPGPLIDGLQLPFSPSDPYLLTTLSQANQGPFQDTAGALTPEGNANATLTLPAGSPPTLAGLTLLHTWLRIELSPAPFVESITHTARLDLQP